MTKATMNLGAAIQAAMMAHSDQDWDKRDVDIEHQGTKITLPGEPGPMPLRKAIETLERKAADEETELDVHEILSAYPEDALVALNTAMRQKYGWASPTPKMSFFGPVAPDLITVKTGPGEHESVQVPFGQFTLPGVENAIEVHRHRERGQPCLVITGTVRKREMAVVKELAQLARAILKEASIYKGQAIRLKVDEDGDLETDTPPEFLGTDYIKPSELVLNPDELEQVKASLWAPVQNTAACIRHDIPLNRGVLLEGTYGTGKTMTANVTSKVCVDNGWTYILLDDIRALKEALLFAQRYQPAVVFAEDVDRVAEHRDQRGNDLLNTIDGVLTKNSQVITVLTTNHVEKLDRAMLRPGRLDAVITVRPPEAEAVERLVRLYGRGLVAADEDLTAVGEALAGNIPATIREVVERSKLAMVGAGRDSVTAEDLLLAGKGMERHLSLLQDVKPQLTAQHQLGAAFGRIIEEHMLPTDTLERKMGEMTDTLVNATMAQLAAASKNAQSAQRGAAAVAQALKPVADKVDAIHDEVCD